MKEKRGFLERMGAASQNPDQRKENSQINFLNWLGEDLEAHDNWGPTAVWELDHDIIPTGDRDFDLPPQSGALEEKKQEKREREKETREILKDLKQHYILARRGDVEGKKARKNPYVIYIIEGLKKLFFVSDAHNNASFIVDVLGTEDITREEVEMWATKTKEDFRKRVGQDVQVLEDRTTRDDWEQGLRKRLNRLATDIDFIESIHDENWKSNWALGRRFGIHGKHVIRLAELCLKQNPKLNKNDHTEHLGQNETGLDIYRFSPELIEAMENRVRTVQEHHAQQDESGGIWYSCKKLTEMVNAEFHSLERPNFSRGYVEKVVEAICTERKLPFIRNREKITTLKSQKEYSAELLDLIIGYIKKNFDIQE